MVFYWEGSNPDLKPVMLTAHQDTVPVQNETLKDWTYPPFAGHYDGEYIYGRGAADCKNVLTAILDTLKIYVNEGYKPTRGIVVGFGFDEEASGYVGAASLAKYLEGRFGKDSMYAIIDEGPGATIDPITKRIIAIPGTSEKGYMDIRVEIITPGGHSSIPPDHTSIGILSELAYIIEKDPFEPILTSKNPTLGYLQCSAIHSGKSISTYLKKMILRAGYDKYANSKIVKLLHDNLLSRYLIQTAQSIDIISGGEKANALPEEAKLVVNHRIAIESSVDEVKDHFMSRVVEVAKRHNLGVNGFGEVLLEGDSKSGTFKVDFLSNPLEPAASTSVDDTVWSYLAGVTRHLFEDLVFQDLDYPVITSPGIMTGNTDTRHYWNLTDHIFRYSPFFVENIIRDTNIHSVDEKLKFDAHLQLTAFFYEYIQTIDTKKADN